MEFGLLMESGDILSECDSEKLNILQELEKKILC